MDLIDKLQDIAERIPNQLDHIQTEEATKNAFIMPFINALGYNVFDPREVVPEYVADVGIKKGEKVDYVIMREGKPSILIECKTAGSVLDLKHASQLFRYFAVTDARIAILTNGLQYQFYSDLDAANKMDDKPFLVFDMLNFQANLVPELKRMSRENFDLEELLSSASELKYTREIKKVLDVDLQTPSDDFVKYFATQVYSGRMTQNALEQFRGLVKKALNQFVTEKVNERLQSALTGDVTPQIQATAEPVIEESSQVETTDDKGIVTTDEELEGFYIVKAILRNEVAANRIIPRDTKSYFGILLDDNNRKPLCRLHFNSESIKYMTLFDANREAYRVDIETVDDIYKHVEALKTALKAYED